MMERGKAYVFGSLGGPASMDRFRESQHCPILVGYRWVHVGAAYYCPLTEEWKYTDADFTKGVTTTSLHDEILASAGIFHFEYFPHHISPWVLGMYEGRPFSKEKARNICNGQATLNDEGVTCGEILALADMGTAWKEMCRKPVFMRPVDWQVYGMSRGIIESYNEHPI